jgi:uncharacterized SAM-binding protein YcdF (DUF218 family)
VSQSTRFRGALAVVKWLCMALGVVVLLVTLTPLDSWWIHCLAGSAYRGRGDILIVLGGTTYSDDALTECSYLRAFYAARYYHERGFQKVIVSGGNGSHEPTAVAISSFIQSRGVPAESIITETSSVSTRENALNVRPLLEKLPGRKALVTSDYHMFRARRVFAKLGIEVLPMPVPDVEKHVGTWSERWSAFWTMALETCKIGYYYARGWL